MKDNCFRELCSFLSNINMNQPYIYICFLPLETPLHLPSQPTPLGQYRAPDSVPWVMQQIPIGSLFHTWWCKFPHYSLHTSHPLLPSPHDHKSVLYVCFSIATLQINSLVPSRFHIYVLVCDIYLSLSDLLHSV